MTQAKTASVNLGRLKLLNRPVYRTLIALLDNYVVNFRSKEITNPAAQREEQDFIDECFKFRPFEILYDYVPEDLRPGISKDQLKSEILRMWFERYTNHYRGRSKRLHWL